MLAVGGLLQFAQWASSRTYKNYQASIDVGRLLPPGTLVHGKLANGLALENRIRPVFVGDHFGNYADRLERDDVRYLLTYIEPREGYEGPIIREVLAAYPHRRLIATFEVAESAGGHDRAALFEKGPRVLARIVNGSLNRPSIRGAVSGPDADRRSSQATVSSAVRTSPARSAIVRS